MWNAKRSVFMTKIINAEREAFRVHDKDYKCDNAKRSVFMPKIINVEQRSVPFHAKNKDY